MKTPLFSCFSCLIFFGVISACGTGSDAPPGSQTGAGASAGMNAGSGGTSAGGSSAGSVSAGGDAGGAPPRISGPPPAGGAFVHLFEWKWPDIAAECENYLGPAGFSAVQVSPPSEHAVITAPRYPWWQRYQNVSYSLAQSRSGTETEFRDMVTRCARAGVGIYVDAVINHMTGQLSGTGSNGTQYTKYNYPGTYAASDFHEPPCAIDGSDYTENPDHVRTCELSGLADLRTEDDGVRGKIAGYLNALVDLGVAGFRVDSAKHMYPADLDAIVSQVNAHAGKGKEPFFFFEVIDSGSEAIHATDYLTVGAVSGRAVSITDFQYRALFDQFDGGDLSQFGALVNAQTALPSAQAVVFTTNHDTERQMGPIFYQDGTNYNLATVLLLAWPYGYPSLMSSYAFSRSNFDLGPPSDNLGHTDSIYAPGSATPNCAPDPTNAAIGSWVCQHRDPFIAPLLAFRKAMVGADAITNFWNQGADQIAFGRGSKGFVVLNRSASALTHAFTTALPAGNYCDVYAGGLKNGECSGATVSVDANGAANITVPAASALVIYDGQKW